MNKQNKNHTDKAAYDKIQLLLMNNRAFRVGLIDEKTRERMEQQILASLEHIPK